MFFKNVGGITNLATSQNCIFQPISRSVLVLLMYFLAFNRNCIHHVQILTFLVAKPAPPRDRSQLSNTLIFPQLLYFTFLY